MRDHLGVVVHGVVVLGCAALAYPTLLRGVDGEGVDIFAALFALALLVLGLPWSLPWFVVIVFESSVPITSYLVLFVVFVFGSALLSVVLHYWWLRRSLTVRASGIMP